MNGWRVPGAWLLLCSAQPRPRAAPTPRFDHVFIIVEENHDYSDVVGSPAMPYLNSLADRYGLATQYYANTHPSIGNYFMLTVGDTVTNDDDFSGIVTHDNIVRQLVAAGKTWKSYAEDLPSVGYAGDGPGAYARRHNPLSYLSDVVNDPVQRQRLVPFSQLASDLANQTLPEATRIRRFLLLTKDLEADDAEMTRTRKVRRRFVAEKYAPVIEAFYSDGAEVSLSTTITYEDGRQATIQSRVRIEDTEPAAERVAVGA